MREKIMFFLVICISFYAGIARAVIMGDVHNDGVIDLGDAVLALQVAGGQTVLSISWGADVDNNQRIGLAEAIYVAQVIAGLRQDYNHDFDGDGFTENRGDCNDNNSSVYPGAKEICGDGVDQDCTGEDLSCAEALEGTWQGYEVNGDNGWAATFSNDQLYFNYWDTDFWSTGIFTTNLSFNPNHIDYLIINSNYADYINKTTHGIFKIEGNKLTVAFNEPGNPTSPSSFNATGARTFILTKQ